MNQKPSVGRIVHAYGRGLGAASYPGGLPILPPPEAAIITNLHEEDGVVDLKIFQSNGIFDQHRVKYSETPAPYCWTWPPRV